MLYSELYPKCRSSYQSLCSVYQTRLNRIIHQREKRNSEKVNIQSKQTNEQTKQVISLWKR